MCMSVGISTSGPKFVIILFIFGIDFMTKDWNFGELAML